MRVLVFLLQAFSKRFCKLFSFEFLSFFETELFFFNGNVSFFGFKHFGRRFCGLFSYEFISFFQTELYFQGECLVFWFPAFCKTVLWHFFI